MFRIYEFMRVRDVWVACNHQQESQFSDNLPIKNTEIVSSLFPIFCENLIFMRGDRDNWNDENFYLFGFSKLISPIFREYYLLIYAYEDFEELLVTAIVDTPPEYDNEVNMGPGFTIQRMGRPNWRRNRKNQNFYR